MAKEKKTPQQFSADPAAQQMLIRAEALGIGTAFTRAEAMPACNIGAAGMCCKKCYMGPCRLTKDGSVGVCGATIDTIPARNFVRMVAAGSAAHSDHGRDLAFTLKAVANGEAEGYSIRDVAKLRAVAAKYGIPTRSAAPKRSPTIWPIKDIAQFGQQRGELDPYQARSGQAPEDLARAGRRAARHRPRSGRSLHRTHMGDDQDPEHIPAARGHARRWPTAGAAR